MTPEALIGVAIVTGLGLLFAVVLALAYRYLRVPEDPRLTTVEEMLPGANCGACGQPGCHAFAEAVIGGKMTPAECTVSEARTRELIAHFLGIAAGSAERRVARLHCAGGRGEAHNLADYRGSLRTCRGEAVVNGGPKACSWGCLGLGDCVTSCTFDAMIMSADGLPVVIEERCVACGDCVDACPKDLFELLPVSQHLVVQCKSELEGDAALETCQVACTGCQRCVADAPEGVITMQHNLAVIQPDTESLTAPAATRRCPTGAIVWLERQQFAEAKPERLPLGRVERYPYSSQVGDHYYQ